MKEIRLLPLKATARPGEIEFIDKRNILEKAYNTRIVILI